MIPASLEAVLGFLMLTAPGALYYLVRESHTPSSKETALSELSRVALASICATLLAGVVLVGWWLPVYRDAATSAGTSALTVSFMVVATAACACGMVLLYTWVRWPGGLGGYFREDGRANKVASWLRRNAGATGRIKVGRGWYQYLVAQRPDGADGAPYLTVELMDGTIWRGTYLSHETDPESIDRTLVIGSPRLARHRPRPSGSDDQKPRAFTDIENYTVVLLNESQIKSVQIMYLPEQDSPSGPPTWPGG